MNRGSCGIGGKAALVGIGQTEFSKESGRSEMQLACEAVKAAIGDAGLRPADIDGMVTFSVDDNEEIEVARNVGIRDLTFFTRVPHGGAAAGTVMQAAMAVATGAASAVVCYRAFNEALRVPLRWRRPPAGSDAAVDGSLCAVRVHDAGRLGRVTRAALYDHIRRHQRRFREDLGYRPQARREQPRRLVLPEADNP